MTLAVEDSKTKLVDIIALADVGDIDTRMRREDSLTSTYHLLFTVGQQFVIV